MRRFVPAVLLLFAILVSEAAGAQKTGSNRKGTTPNAKKAPARSEVVEVPPAVEEAPPPPPPPVAPRIDFDTTAVPEDTLTSLIRDLLNVTGALENDARLAERALNESLRGEVGENPMIQEFKKRFMHEIQYGRSRRWLTNLYIRKYRSIFTADEVKSLTRFYQTPQGGAIAKKQLQLAGSILSEARKIGEYLGGTLMQEIMEEQSKK